MLIRNAHPQRPRGRHHVTSDQPGFESAGAVLRHLMDQRHPGMGVEALAREVELSTGVRMSGGLLWRFSTGRVATPSREKLAAVAKHFGVDVATFFPPYRITPARQTLLEMPSLAERLNHLIDTMHPADQPAATDEDIAQAMAAHGCPTPAFVIHALRAGDTEAENTITLAQLRALATIFGLPSVGPLVDGAQAARLDGQLDALAAERDAGPVRQTPQRHR
jgi:transcriptional regulator with XRE-family HTH domain